MRHAWLLLAVTLTAYQACHASQILMITMGGTKSHTIPFLELGKGMVQRGHNITFVSAFPQDSNSYMEEITPNGLVFYVRNYTNWDLLGARIRNEEPVPLRDAVRYGYEACDALLTDPETHQLLRSGRHYDLLILDGAYPDCALGFAHHYKAPYMFINTVAFYTQSMSLAGNPVLYSVTPFFARAFTDTMNIVQRIQNAGYLMLTTTMHSLQTRVVLGVLRRHWPDMPSVLDMSRNVSFILQNSHPAITYPRPYLPNVAEIGCIHCKPAKPLPQDLEDFVAGNGDVGFIYVSMGSSVKASNMPEYLRLLFVKVFAQLPYRVLWKWEGGNGSMSDLTPNVWLSRWLPQQDVLGHRKIRAFITHAGLLSMFETVYHAVPIITMPVFCDQDSNAMKAEVDGYSIKIDLQHLTTERLLRAVNKIVHDPRYRDNVNKRSQLLRDQPDTPLNRAIYWTEFVLRHRGAHHLQSPSKDMSIMQYYMIDAALLMLALLCVAVLVFKRSSSILTVFKSCAKLRLKKTKTVKQH